MTVCGFILKVSWMNHYIEFGEGNTLGENRLLFVSDPRTDKTVTSLAFTTTPRTTGQWELRVISSKYNIRSMLVRHEVIMRNCQYKCHA